MQRKAPAPHVLLIVHAAFMVAVLAYAAIAHLFIPTIPNRPPFDPVVAYALIGVAICMIPLGFVFPVILAKKGSTPPAIFIITDAAFESIAIYGLVGTIFNMPLLWADLLFGVSFMLLALNTIRLRTLRESDREF